MVKTSFSELIKNTKTSAFDYYELLVSNYGEAGICLPLKNLQNNNFYLFPKAYKNELADYYQLTNRSLKLRDSHPQNYFRSGYQASEIYSTLRMEGVHSTRPIVNKILQNNSLELVNELEQLSKLVKNMDLAMRFILSNPEINDRNLQTIYLLMTADLTANAIEPGHLYRQELVKIGKDKGYPSEIIVKRMASLWTFLNEAGPEIDILVKSLASYAYFELVHPYYDFNGRIGRLLILWILANNDYNDFWRCIFLSEAIYPLRDAFNQSFEEMFEAKKQNANIDLSHFVKHSLSILNTHTRAYIKMKQIILDSKINLERSLRLFIIDMIYQSDEDYRFFSLTDFRRLYQGFSETHVQRLLTKIKRSGLFQIRSGRPVQFRLRALKNKI